LTEAVAVVGWPVSRDVDRGGGAVTSYTLSLDRSLGGNSGYYTP
jgi:hypothetical protein